MSPPLLGGSINFSEISYCFDTEDYVHAEDHDDKIFDLGPLLLRVARQDEACSVANNRANNFATNDSMQLISTFGPDDMAGWTLTDHYDWCYLHPSDGAADNHDADYTSSENTIVKDDYTIEHVISVDEFGVEEMIQHPMKVLKKRLRFKLLFLLNAGCDPNVLNHAGESPSEYARQDGLWPQWSWALKNTGYVYDAESGRYVR